MAVLKTQKTKASVTDFLKAVDEKKQKDANALLKLMKEATGEKPAMWGDRIVGFGSFSYKSDRSSQQGDWFLTGFAPRKQNMTVYVITGFGAHKDLMKKLGKFKASGSCLHINKMEDIDPVVLKELISRGYKQTKEKFPSSKHK